MKYIVMSVKFKASSGGEVEMELPIIFPDALVHADMAAAAADACRLNWPLAQMHPLSAGFISSTVVGNNSSSGNCYGKSDSLGKLKSRGAVDDLLIC